MAIEVLLVENVADLGKIGDVVRVSDGYARNFLLPKKLATPVTKAALRAIETKKVKAAAEEAARVEAFKVQADAIGRLAITLTVKAGEDDKLYGSVNVPQILEALAKENVTVEKTAVVMPEAIKALGEYNIEIKLHPEVQAALKVRVVRA